MLVRRRMADRAAKPFDIVRMHTLQHEFERRYDPRLELENPEGLLGPDDFAAPYVPAEAARAAQALCLGEVRCLAAPQRLFGLLARRNVVAGFERRERTTVAVALQRPAAGDHKFGAIAARVNQLAIPAPGAQERRGYLFERRRKARLQ